MKMMKMTNMIMTAIIRGKGAGGGMLCDECTYLDFGAE